MPPIRPRLGTRPHGMSERRVHGTRRLRSIVFFGYWLWFCDDAAGFLPSTDGSRMEGTRVRAVLEYRSEPCPLCPGRWCLSERQHRAREPGGRTVCGRIDSQ